VSDSLIKQSDQDDTFARYVAERCQHYYPGHTWIVQAFLAEGYCTIQNPSISYRYGMRMILPDYLPPGDLDKKIMRFCGEFLERYDIRRQRADRDETQERWKRARFQ
jgi:hypothetical protein